jgi:hypothetical protein
VATLYGESVDVLLNQGHGTFAARVSYRTGFRLVSVAAGDFNGDGKLDLAVANAGTSTSSGASMSVLLNQGSGTFATPVTYGTGGNRGSVSVGDFNGDGKPDIAVGGGHVSVLLNQDSGTFPVNRVYESGVQADSVLVGDFNGDGRPDLAVEGRFGTNVLINQCLR